MKPEDISVEQKGIKLTDEQLKAASGGKGGINKDKACPKCGNARRVSVHEVEGGLYRYTCNECGHEWLRREW